MEFFAYLVVIVVLGLIGYAAYRARQQKLSDRNSGSGRTYNRDSDLR